MKDGRYFEGMNLYSSGVFDAVVHFQEEGLMIAYVDQRTRFLQTPTAPWVQDFVVMDLAGIQKKCPEYLAARWEGERVELPCGDVYSRHITYEDQTGRVSQVWAQRNADPALDIITLEGEVIAFLMSNRYGMEVVVRPGCEDLTPLVQYRTDPLLSQPVYGIDCLGIQQCAMRDGVKLAQRVYLPQGGQPGQKWPTILVRSCYTKERFGYKLSKYVNKGYALVMQDVRGRGDSEGDLDPFAYERDDGSDTVDWIVSQPWSDGNVGMWGASYLGHVVVQAATSGNPHLKCVIDEVNVGSPFIDTVRRGGALCSQPLLCWALAQSSGQRPNMYYMSDTVDWAPMMDIRPLSSLAEKVLGTPKNDLWKKWTTHDEENAWWQRGDFTRNFHRVKVPMMVISGWYDGDGLGVSETWRGLTKYDVPGRRIVLGPWEHGPNTTRDVEGVAFGNNAIIYNFDINNLRWYDYYLKGIQNGMDGEPRATYYVVGENQWHTSDDWSPAEARMTCCYLDSDGRANSCWGDGRLEWENPAQECSDTYHYDPQTPFSDLVSAQVGHRSPINYKGHESGEDMLVYTSKPLERDVILAGEISAEFFASSSALDTDWILRLTDVDEEGNSRQLSENIIRAKFRDGFETAKLLEPGKVERYFLQMESNGWRLAKGHRLRVQVQSSSKNLVFPNTNTGDNPFEDMGSVVAVNKIYHGGRYPSHINLPLIFC